MACKTCFGTKVLKTGHRGRPAKCPDCINPKKTPIKQVKEPKKPKEKLVTLGEFKDAFLLQLDFIEEHLSGLWAKQSGSVFNSYNEECTGVFEPSEWLDQIIKLLKKNGFVK